jgi:hypothetical protein
MASIVPKKYGDLNHMRMCELLDRIVLERRYKRLAPSLVVNPVTGTFYEPPVQSLEGPSAQAA